LIHFYKRNMSLVLKSVIRDEVAAISYDSEVKKAESALCKHSHEGISENSFCTTMIDLPAESYTEYTEHVTESMGLNEDNTRKVLNSWQSVKWGGATMTMVKQKTNVGGFKFVWVILAAKKKQNGTYDLAYSTHNVKMGASSMARDDLNAITESYGPYKCMLQLKSKALC